MRDIYSKRNKKATEKLVYDIIDEKLRVQIVRTWLKFFNQYKDDITEPLWKVINRIICDEHGKHTLVKETAYRFKERFKCQHYFENLKTIEESFDVIEIVFRAILGFPEMVDESTQPQHSPEEIINELNDRFRENDFGYEFSNGRIVRIDNNLLHQNIINQTIHLTNDPLFSNANEEFISALDHLKHRRNKEA